MSTYVEFVFQIAELEASLARTQRELTDMTNRYVYAVIGFI